MYPNLNSDLTSTRNTLKSMSNCIFKSGTVVRNVASWYNGTYVGGYQMPVFADSEVASILGVEDVSSQSAVVFFMNGDGDSFDAIFWGGEKYKEKWYMKSSEALPAGSVRINYLICYWG